MNVPRRSAFGRGVVVRASVVVSLHPGPSGFQAFLIKGYSPGRIAELIVAIRPRVRTGAREDLYALIIERHRRSSFIVTSNRDVAEWFALFADPIVANSALDRLANGAHHLVIEGLSYRAKLAPRPPPGDAYALIAAATTTLEGGSMLVAITRSTPRRLTAIAEISSTVHVSEDRVRRVALHLGWTVGLAAEGSHSVGQTHAEVSGVSLDGESGARDMTQGPVVR